MQTAVAVGLGVLAFYVAILTVHIGGNWLLARFRKPKTPSEESIRRYRERLLSPRWDELQKHFGLAIPEPIKSLYKQMTLLTAQNVVFREKGGKECHVAEFYPADTQTLEAVGLTWRNPRFSHSRSIPLATPSTLNSLGKSQTHAR